jgi:hypothetical protein
MYRNVVYKVGPDTGWKGEIILWTWDDDGKPVEKVYPHRSKAYIEMPNGHSETMFDTPCDIKMFDSVIERSRWLKNNVGRRVYESFGPEREFLIEMFGGQQEEDEFSKFPLRIHYLDAEMAVDDSKPQPDDPKYPINVLSIYDNILD